jgi:hypothetical protein
MGGGGGGDGAGVTQGVPGHLRHLVRRDQIIAGRTSFADLAVLHDQILAGRASFADLAMQQSDCSSAHRGGDLRCYFFPRVRELLMYVWIRMSVYSNIDRGWSCR